MTQTQQIQGVDCPHCGTLNEAGESNCFSCGQALSPSENPPPQSSPSMSREAKTFSIIGGVIILSVICLSINDTLHQNNPPGSPLPDLWVISVLALTIAFVIFIAKR